jgi:hypothetical protein
MALSKVHWYGASTSFVRNEITLLSPWSRHCSGFRLGAMVWTYSPRCPLHRRQSCSPALRAVWRLGSLISLGGWHDVIYLSIQVDTRRTIVTLEGSCTAPSLLLCMSVRDQKPCISITTYLAGSGFYIRGVWWGAWSVSQMAP